MAIKENKETFNKFIKDQRINRAKEDRMIQKMKSTGVKPTYTFDELLEKKSKDVDLGMDSYLEPPKLGLPA